MDDDGFKLSDLLIGGLVGVVVFSFVGAWVLWLVARLITWITGDMPEIGEPAGTLLLTLMWIVAAVAGVLWRRRHRLAKARMSRSVS